MMWENTKRVFRSGFINFWRNGVISVASIFVVTVTLFIIGSLILASAFIQGSLENIKEKVDINVYFKEAVPEGQILALKKELELLPEVKKVDYLSREEVLAKFRETNQDNTLISQTLEELGNNPFGAVLTVKAKEPSQYEGIATFLNKRYSDQALGSGEQSIIDNINYFKNKVVIDRLSKILDASRTVGLAISITLAIMAILVTFNTIRLAIYNAREEIGVMKLVGASGSYIRGPFIVEGIMYGVVGAVITMILLYPTTLWVSHQTSAFFGGVDMFSYYLSNFGQLLLIVVLSGIVLGIISSGIAVRRYLR